MGDDAGLDKKAKKKKARLQSEATADAEAEPEVKRKKKKARVDSDAPEAAEAEPEVQLKKKGNSGGGSTAAAAEDADGKKDRKGKKGKKNKKKKNGSDNLPSADDDERRNMQREIQQLVVRLRAEGKSKHEIEAAKRDLKVNSGKNFRKPDSSRAKKTEAWKEREAAKAAEKTTKAGKSERLEKTSKAAEKTSNAANTESTGDSAGSKAPPAAPAENVSWEDALEEKRKKALETKHDIVVIPVIWRGRHDHKEIEKAAQDVKSVLSQQGLDVWVDSRRHYTPGQKFAHWEFRGVMIRIEIGPEDFEAGKLKLCKAKEAGDYKSVEKKVLRLPPRGTRQLLLALKEWGFSKLEIERREGDDESDEDDDLPTSKSGSREAAKAGNAQEDDGDLAGNWQPRVQEDSTKKKKKKKSS